MSDFGTLADNLRKIDSNKLFREVFSDPAFQRWILTRPKERIQNTGINSDGKKLKTIKASSGNFYADRTIDIKDFLGQTFSHVTLTDTGDFWDSFRFELQSDGFEIRGDYIKDGEHIGSNFPYSLPEFYETTSGLNEQELTEMKTRAMDIFIKKLNEIL
jgi:hypothetical protein